MGELKALGGHVASEEVSVPVTVYPGIFPTEYQITLQFGGHEINANVAQQFVRPKGQVTEKGVPGHLIVVVLDRLDGGDQVMVSVPGEVQGAPSRIRLPEKILQPA